MASERNALAELAERLEVEAKFAQESGRNGRPIYDASRIVAELAKVESLYEKMNANASNGHIVEAEELAHELHLAKGSLFANCRAIAEEGAGDGK